jgi:hypothetical protein
MASVLLRDLALWEPSRNSHASSESFPTSNIYLSGYSPIRSLRVSRYCSLFQTDRLLLHQPGGPSLSLAKLSSAQTFCDSPKARSFIPKRFLQTAHRLVLNHKRCIVFPLFLCFRCISCRISGSVQPKTLAVPVPLPASCSHKVLTSVFFFFFFWRLACRLHHQRNPTSLLGACPALLQVRIGRRYLVSRA